MLWNKPDDCPTVEIHNLTEAEAETKAKAVLAEHLERALTIINPETIFREPDLESYFDGNGRRCYRARGEGARIRRENRVKRLAEIKRQEQLLRDEAEGMITPGNLEDWNDDEPR